MLLCFSLAPWIVKFRLGINGARHNRWHFAAFFITAIVFSKPGPFEWQSDHQNLLWQGGASSQVFRFLTASLIAISLEALEVAFYHNPFEWRDVWVDCAGIVMGFASLATWHMLAVPNRLTSIREAERASDT